MIERNWHHVWREQCDDAETIKLRYGLKMTLDYAIREKLLNYVQATVQRPELRARAASVRLTGEGNIKIQEIYVHLERIESGAPNPVMPDVEADDLDFEDPTAMTERARRFDIVKELLAAPAFGTS